MLHVSSELLSQHASNYKWATKENFKFILSLWIDLIIGLFYKVLHDHWSAPRGHVFADPTLYSALLYASYHYSCQVQLLMCFRDTRCVQVMTHQIDGGLHCRFKNKHFFSCDISVFGTLSWFSGWVKEQLRTPLVQLYDQSSSPSGSTVLDKWSTVMSGRALNRPLIPALAWPWPLVFKPYPAPVWQSLQFFSLSPTRDRHQ